MESVAEHEALGWAIDETVPHAHLSVTAWLDGRKIVGGTADLARRDLKVAGFGDGDHGFRLTFPISVPPGDLSRLKIQAEIGGKALELQKLAGSNWSRADAASDAAVPFSDPAQRPVFVLGPARSGTSALTLALLKSGRFEGYGEGHLLPLAHELTRTVDCYYENRSSLSNVDTFLRSVHRDAFQRAIRRSFVQLTRAAYPSGYWIDKTPTAAMVRAAPLMLEIWPSARFVFLKRRVIENILSRRRKFPRDTLQNHYLDWVDVLSAWRDVRGQLGPAALELEQLEMARQNNKSAAQIARFLQLSPEQAEALRQVLAIDHPEQTSETVGLSASLESLALSSDDTRELRRACDPIMSEFGWSYGREYYAPVASGPA